jgi:hypothetical protein
VLSLCAGVVAGVLALQNGVVPGKSNAGAASAGSETVSAEQTTTATTPSPTFPAPYGELGKAYYEKLEDLVQITEKDGKYYADEILNLVVANESVYGLDVAWCDKAVRGDFTKDEMLAEFAKADEHAAAHAPHIERITLPDGIISADQALTTARQVYLEDLGLDTTGCAIADRFSYSQSVLYGTDELFDPMYRYNQFAGRKLLVITFLSVEDINKSLNVKHPGWQFELIMDGKAAAQFPCSVVVIDAATGDVLYKAKDVPQTPQHTPADSPAPSNGATPNPSPYPTATPNDIPQTPDTTAMMQTTYQPGVDPDAAKRNCALGNVSEFAYFVKTDDGIDYVITGQSTEGLSEYCDHYFRANKHSPLKHELDPTVHPGLIFVLVDGLVDKNFVGTTISEEKLNTLIAANNDDKQDGVYVRGMLGKATLEFSDDFGTFKLTIHNVNPSFRPTSNFTILTRYAPADGLKYTIADYDSSSSGKVQYYALQVSGK